MTGTVTQLLIRNRHPADELADVRAEIKQLKIREAELRRELMSGADRRGVQWQAIVHNSRREYLDTKATIEHFGRDAMLPFFKEATTVSIRLNRTEK
jgi:hypothetical protein